MALGCNLDRGHEDNFVCDALSYFGLPFYDI